MIGGTRVFERARCARCGACAEVCPAGALEKIGKRMSARGVIAVVLRDRPFYETSGGGITISGGEPMARFAFTERILAEARKQGIHTCLETSGHGAAKDYRAILPHVDLFLLDYKDSDPERYRLHTGESPENMMRCLEELDKEKACIILRCPIISGVNAETAHFEGISRLTNRLAHIQEIHLLAYHPLGESKSRRIGRNTVSTAFSSPSQAERMKWAKYLAGKVHVPVSWL